MQFSSFIFFVLFVLPRSDADEVTFEKQQLTDHYYCDGVNAANINNDGQMDIIAGPWVGEIDPAG
jgi:hypothetical protein